MAGLLAAMLVAAAAQGAPCLKCHAALLADKKPHAPVKDGCSGCHQAQPGAAGKCKSPTAAAWKLAAPDQPALCGKCHDTSGAGKQHAVIKSSGCTACHDPHASKNPALLKTFPVVALCYKCHSKYDDAEFIHSAVKQGKCLGCHSPHAGEAEPLLIDKREALCASCHKRDALLKGESVHAPAVEGKCLGCHDPHRSDVKAQLADEVNAVCLKCHDAKQKGKPGAPRGGQLVDLSLKHVHSPLKSGECTDCHRPHAAANPRLLKAAPPALCFRCHARNDDTPFVHGAVKLGDCVVCHAPHSSANATLLTEATAAAVCFRCHQDDITGRAWVHKPAGEGKCLACHEPHGGDVRFNLKAGPGAAACTGCHQDKGEAKVPHAVLQRQGCTPCHDPHGSSNALGLIKPLNELCASCHPGQADGVHASTFSGGHMVAGDWDPRRKGRPFSCASCHDPHGSDNPKLFYLGKDAFEMCDGCHGDRTGAHPERKDIHRRPPRRGTAVTEVKP
ncbi:MAG TPA: cytochrome c3 family protein [Myxococcales bacterium]|nr:cytochrome c3 family protein [Myxococcales bacterium]